MHVSKYRWYSSRYREPKKIYSGKMQFCPHHIQLRFQPNSPGLVEQVRVLRVVCQKPSFILMVSQGSKPPGHPIEQEICKPFMEAVIIAIRIVWASLCLS